MGTAKKSPDIEGRAGSQFLEENSSAGIPDEKSEGNVRISEDVIAQIATQALLKVNGVRPASPGLVANLRIGKKTSGGVRISVEEGDVPSVVVDAYITTKYGLRIPDIAWDVQESIKKTLEQYTGYNVKGVNVFVQGVFFDTDQTKEAGQGGKSSKNVNPDLKD
ncbi:MAG: Asp23/Gls24 family envelope stress response protein [Thermovirgaceae bacterium]|nr:Asp23/Gls24 family envelope stress response protein [Thermovirgaceae bacterium]